MTAFYLKRPVTKLKKRNHKSDPNMLQYVLGNEDNSTVTTIVQYTKTNYDLINTFF